ncbi:MAG TPA: ATP-binding protein [Solirubrobacterales bacterium]|nr:ATP-binding protein [Solirubrobacterales bacterium]
MIGTTESAVAAWPLLVTIACALAVDRRRASRRREALNRALHELRRPLQILALTAAAPASRSAVASSGGATVRDHVGAAIAALDTLDAELNGRPQPRVRRVLRADRLAGEAVARWSGPAALLGREIDLRWRAGPAEVVGDPAALGRALDNLLANSLEHGAEQVLVEGAVDGDRLRIAVADGSDPERGAGELAAPLRTRPGGRDPRRGHGLAIVAGTAAAHRGRFAFAAGERGARAVIELPIACDRAGLSRASPPADVA